MTKPNNDLETLVATALYGFVRAAVSAGMDPAQALRLSAFAVIESSLGRDPIRSLGLPRSTAARWRRELVAAASGEVPEGIETDLIYEVLGFAGFPDLRVSVGEVSKDVPNV